MVNGLSGQQVTTDLSLSDTALRPLMDLNPIQPTPMERSTQIYVWRRLIKPPIPPVMGSCLRPARKYSKVPSGLRAALASITRNSDIWKVFRS